MRICTKVMLCALSALAPAAVQASTTGTTMTINGSVVSSCTIAAAPLTFNAYSGAVVNTTTTLSPNCSNGTPYYIQIDAGGGAGATTGVRKLTNGSSQTLDYSLYTTATYTTAWGTVMGTDTVASTGTGTTQTISVYGRILAGQSAAVGTGYTDTVNITLNF